MDNCIFPKIERTIDGCALSGKFESSEVSKLRYFPLIFP